MPQQARVRATRLEFIRDLLSAHVVTGQDEILSALRARGERVTQSSVSRDLQHLGVRKSDGRYLLPRAVGPATADALHEAALSVLGMDPAGPFTLVLKTPAGHASALAVALDGAGWAEVVGTVSGGDTVFLATRNRRDQARVERRLRSLRARAPAG